MGADARHGWSSCSTRCGLCRGIGHLPWIRGSTVATSAAGANLTLLVVLDELNGDWIKDWRQFLRWNGGGVSSRWSSAVLGSQNNSRQPPWCLLLRRTRAHALSAAGSLRASAPNDATKIAPAEHLLSERRRWSRSRYISLLHFQSRSTLLPLQTGLHRSVDYSSWMRASKCDHRAHGISSSDLSAEKIWISHISLPARHAKPQSRGGVFSFR